MAPSNSSPADFTDTQVLICGAGPTGLVLALWLQRLGVRVRVIDKADAPGTTSRALVVHARTLEFYQQLGLAQEVVRRGLEFAAINLWVRGQHRARVKLGEIGQGLSPFPFVLVYPQDQHEQLLIDELAKVGIVVERSIELVSFQQTANHVLAQMKRADGSHDQCHALYLAGCDGAHSIVREQLAAEFPGGTYARLFYVADIEATGSVVNHELNLALDNADFVGVFPLPGVSAARLIGTIETDAATSQQTPTWDDVSTSSLQQLQLQVQRLNWFSTYRVHHRVAQFFRQDRVFLLGDAAHIHSPVGGQGMNTGIGDAVNLAWKLAAVLHGEASPALLASYEPERIAFARRLVATTDRAFTFVTSPGRLAAWVRTVIVPRVLPALLRWPGFRRWMFRTVSQIAIQYRHSSLSQGRAGELQSGDRLPWLPHTTADDDACDNFAPLNNLAWQVHVYGECDDDLAAICTQRQLPLYRFPWSETARRAGLTRGTLYLLRPDGYIALIARRSQTAALARYLDRWQIRIGPTSATGDGTTKQD